MRRWPPGHGERSASWGKAALAIAAIFVVAACGGELQTPGEALRIFGDSLPEAYVGEPYDAQVRAVGGLRPFTFALQEGELPPGVDLEAGVLSGTPTETGIFEFTVMVSDANLSRTFQEYSLEVVERPPPTLTLVAPETEIRTPTVVRLRVEDASALRAFTSEVSWDDTKFELVEDSVEAATAGAAIVWRTEPGTLHLEMAALGAAWDGEITLAQFTLAPTAPAELDPGAETLFLDDHGGSHFQRIAGEAGQDPAVEDREPVPAAGEAEDAGSTAGETAGDEDGPGDEAPGDDDPGNDDPSNDDSTGEDPGEEAP